MNENGASPKTPQDAPPRHGRLEWVVVALYALEWTRGVDFRVL